MREKGVQIDEFPSPDLLRNLSRDWWRARTDDHLVGVCHHLSWAAKCAQWCVAVQ